MDVNYIVQFVQSVGFPIACCIALFGQVNKLNEQHREELAHIMDQHKEEVNALRDALDRNTQVMTRLEERLGGGAIEA